MTHSKYWDDFQRRARETVYCLQNNKPVPVRRVAVFITNQCNFRCSYCNHSQDKKQMQREVFEKIIEDNRDAIIHITGGEPSTVSWLYDFIDSTPGVRFHLNTNGFIKPPRNIQRLKASLDTVSPKYFDFITGTSGAYNKVMQHIQEASLYTTVSITYTLTKENYLLAPSFMRQVRKTFPKVYATFFSVYKGTNPRFMFNEESANDFFENVKYNLELEMDEESYRLFQETITEKQRIMQGIRFPENKIETPCYLSMSERVFSPSGEKFNCSHLYRDSIQHVRHNIQSRCQYGCNTRLAQFNQDVAAKLTQGP